MLERTDGGHHSSLYSWSSTKHLPEEIKQSLCTPKCDSLVWLGSTMCGSISGGRLQSTWGAKVPGNCET